MSSNLPTTTSEITPTWLTDVLRESGTLAADESVVALELDAGSAGVGFMGEIGKLRVTYSDGADAPATLIAKFPTHSPEVRAMFHPTRIYEREHRFYRELAGRSPLRTPAIHHVTCEVGATPDDERYLLIMEDLSSLTLGDQLSGVSPDQAERALVALAGHHAAFWNGAGGLDDADFVPVINGPLNQAGASIYEVSLPGFMEAFGDAIKPELREYVRDYASYRAQIIDDLAAMPHTLVHFDFRADNLLFDDDGSVAVVDWQTISRGGAAADLGYFLSQNLDTEVRRAHELDLLRAYHDALVSHGVDDYSFDALVADFRVGITCGWVVPVLAVGTLDFTSERAIALWTAVIERVQNALIDHGYGS